MGEAMKGVTKVFFLLKTRASDYLDIHDMIGHGVDEQVHQSAQYPKDHVRL
jgi:hypothetical protein